ncbi:MAG: hypothetical protein D6722_19685, partial [Bacteroidetes bacterium]
MPFPLRLPAHLLATGLLLLLACRPPAASPPYDSLIPTDTLVRAEPSARAQLRQETRQARRFLILYDSPDPAARAAYQEALTRLAQGNRYLEVVVSTPQAADSLQAHTWPLLLVGTPAAFPLLSRPELPLRATAEGFFLDSEVLSGKDLLAQVHIVPHPERPRQALSYLTASTDSRLLDFLQSPQANRLLRERWAYQVLEGADPWLIGDLNSEGKPNPNRQWDLRPPPQA